jgi:hypothetical protein
LNVAEADTTNEGIRVSPAEIAAVVVRATRELVGIAALNHDTVTLGDGLFALIASRLSRSRSVGAGCRRVRMARRVVAVVVVARVRRYRGRHRRAGVTRSRARYHSSGRGDRPMIAGMRARHRLRLASRPAGVLLASNRLVGRGHIAADAGLQVAVATLLAADETETGTATSTLADFEAHGEATEGDLVGAERGTGAVLCAADDIVDTVHAVAVPTAVHFAVSNTCGRVRGADLALGSGDRWLQEGQKAHEAGHCEVNHGELKEKVYSVYVNRKGEEKERMQN